jgi:hypothetical protein
MRNFFRFLLKSHRLHSYLKRTYMDALDLLPAAPGLPESSIPELTQLNCRVSNFNSQRLNLLVPTLAMRHVFGGISTALDLFRELAGDDINIRIILTDSQTFHSDENPAYAGWRVASLSESDCPGRLIIPAGDRYGQSLSVGRGDRFVATAWWSAVLAEAIQEWQGRTFGMAESPRFLYLIQDYEPGFYPWSARYALADATYRSSERMIALFNTRILRHFFEDEGYSFELAYEFDPRLSEQLRQLRDNAMTLPRERRVLVYGRPSVARNAFQIIVEGLRRFVDAYPDNDWTFVSAGELHPPIELGRGRLLNSVGKLSIEKYAEELGRSSIGISLMVSPHPSYPPLEMAAFGMQVITNRYKSKNLSELSPNIHSLTHVSPSALASGLAALVYSPVKTVSSIQNAQLSPFFYDYLHGTPEFSQLTVTLRSQLL